MRRSSKYRKPIALFIPSLLIVLSLVLVGYAWCKAIDRPLNELVVLDVRYLPVVFTYLKLSLYYISYLWALYLFTSLYYYEVLGFRKLFRVYLIHTIIIVSIALAGIIPSYMIFIKILKPNNFFVYYFPFTMLFLEIYAVIALFHSLYHVLDKLLYPINRTELVGMTFLIYMLGFLISFIMGSVLSSHPSVYYLVIRCETPMFELEQWIPYILPTILSLIDSYISPITRYMFIVYFVNKMKRHLT